jgi:hypothetical protein
MTTWPKDQLKKIAEADDLHIAPLREDGDLRHADLDLVGRRRRRPLCPRL